MLAPALLAIATGIGPIIRTLNQFANCRGAADRPGTQGRGGVGLHPGGGRRPGRRVPAGGPAGRRGTPADHLGAGLRHHRRRLGDGAGRRGDVGRTRASPPPRSSGSARAPASPGSRSSSRTAGSPGTCTSGTSSTSRPSSATSRCRPAGSGRCPRCRPATDLRTALDRMRRIGAHLAEVAEPPVADAGRCDPVAGDADRPEPDARSAAGGRRARRRDAGGRRSRR